MKILKPKFWDQNYFTFLSILLLPFTLVYIFIVYLKKILINPKKFSIPIICVGNIYLGGTGKTPISSKVYKIFADLNRNPVVIKKKYVDQNDELALLKKYTKVIVSKNREDAINKAIEKKYNLAILDDGFQDTSIKKDLNIICFHSKQKVGNGFVIPAGPLRESLSKLKKCQIVLINGKKDFEFEQSLKKHNSELKIFYYSYVAKNIEYFKNKKLIAFAGIGNPQNFFDLLKENHLNIVKEISYPDHFLYSENDLNKLNNFEVQYKAKLVTTEKDFLRLNPFVRKKYDFVKIEVKFDDEETFKKALKI